jgi:hypothetical protein
MPLKLSFWCTNVFEVIFKIQVLKQNSYKLFKITKNSKVFENLKQA